MVSVVFVAECRSPVTYRLVRTVSIKAFVTFLVKRFGHQTLARLTEILPVERDRYRRPIVR